MIRRESSEFMRKKQEQWERGKADPEQSSEWFPFGENQTPGGGSPLRRHAPKEPHDREISPDKTVRMLPRNLKNATNSGQPGEAESLKKQEEPAPELHATSSDHQNAQSAPSQHHQNQQTVPTYPYPLYAFPYAAPHPHFAPYHPGAPPPLMTSMTSGASGVTTTTTSSSSEPPPKTPHFFAPQYQVIPAGAIPVSTISIDPSQICPIDQMGIWTMPPPTGPNGMRYGIPIPAPLVPQIAAASMTSSSATSAVLNAMMATSSTTTGNDSSSESGVSGVKDDKESKEDDDEDDEDEEDDEEKEKRRGQQEERQSTSDYTDDDPIPLSRRNTTTTTSSSYNYEEQIAERRRYEAEEENRERQEMLEVERQRRILEERRNSEDERRKRVERERLEEDQRRAAQFAEAMEKAKKEAALLKRTKLYKHVLRGAEEEGGAEQLGELEKQLLGVDLATGRRLLKEVSDVEWHKKQDHVEMLKKAPEKSSGAVAAAANGSMMSIGGGQRARSTSIQSTPPPHSPFGRNGFGRRSVRTTSREKREATVVEPAATTSSGRSIHEHIRAAAEPKTDNDERPDPLLRARSAVPPPPVPPDSARNFENRPCRRLGSPPDSPNSSSIRPEMLKSANFYCPINREPLTYREESRLGPTTTSLGVGNRFDGGRHNEITQSALFGRIQTRNSIRRGQMRPIGMESPTTVRGATQPQKLPPQQRTSSFEGSSSGGEDGGSISPDLSHKNFESPLPSSTENVHPAPITPPPVKNEKSNEINGFEYQKTPRTRSALGSPMSLLNGTEHTNLLTPSRCSTPLGSSRLMQKLEQKGTIRREDELISQDVRRLAETNLSRSPSMASLRGSFQNLSMRGSHLNLAHSGEPSPNLSKFASVSSPARQSLNSLKKTTDRQAAVLERLGRLRESLHAGKNYTPPRGTSGALGASSTRLNSLHHQTPPVSPRPVL